MHNASSNLSSSLPQFSSQPSLGALMTRKMPVVFHVGHLQGRPAEPIRASHEGFCLSVSTQPAAWRRIAKLGNAPTWRLELEGALFVDVYGSLRKNAVAEELVDWGTREGLIEAATLWEAWEEDTESGRWRYTLHPDEESARGQLEDPDGLDGNGRPVVRESTRLVETALLQQLTGCPKGFPNTLDFVLMAALRQLNHSQGPDHSVVEGLFWNDELDEFALSAPRAGIFEDCLPRWDRRLVTNS